MGHLLHRIAMNTFATANNRTCRAPWSVSYTSSHLRRLREASRGTSEHPRARQRWQGVASPGAPRRPIAGWARRTTAGRGRARRGKAPQAWLGRAWFGKAGQGEAPQARRGAAWPGEAGQSTAGKASRGTAERARATYRRLRMARHGRRGVAQRGLDWQSTNRTWESGVKMAHTLYHEHTDRH